MASSRKLNSSNPQAPKSQRSLSKKIAFTAILIALVLLVSIVTFSIQSNTSEYGFEVPLREGLHSPPYIYTLDISVENQPRRIPPTSGNHFEILSRWGFLGAPLVPENVVHNMEHGGVVLWYKSGDATLAGSVNRLIGEVGKKCMVGGSYEDMSYEVAATVWGRVLPLEKFDAIQLKGFISKYRGTQGPEAPLCKAQS